MSAPLPLMPPPLADTSANGLHVRYQYIVRGVSVPGASLSYGVTRADGLRYDFSDGTFVATPQTPTSALLPTAPGPGLDADLYVATISPAPAVVTVGGVDQQAWTDGLYAVTIYSGTDVVRVLSATMAGGDDGCGAAPMPAATTIDAILRDVKQYLVDLGVVKPSCALVTEDRRNFPISGVPMLALYPGDFRRTGDGSDGAGRRYRTLSGRFEIAYVDRSLSDQARRDDARVAGSTGIVAKAHAVADALEHYFPIDAAGNALAVEPLRVGSLGTPTSVFGDGEKKTPDYKRVDVPVDLVFRARLGGL